MTLGDALRNLAKNMWDWYGVNSSDLNWLKIIELTQQGKKRIHRFLTVLLSSQLINQSIWALERKIVAFWIVEYVSIKSG